LICLWTTVKDIVFFLFMTEYKCCMSCIAFVNALVELQIKTDRKMPRNSETSGS